MTHHRTDSHTPGRGSGLLRILFALLLLASLPLVTACGGRQANGSELSDAQADQPDDAQDAEAEEGEKDETNGKAPVPVAVAQVTRGDVSAYITATANLVAENQVKILAEAEGRVARLLVEEGTYVQKGQELASLVRDDAEIALEKARLRESNARLAYERAQGLFEEELLAREDFDKLAMDYNLARQELAEAEWKLGKTTIRAPFSGQISERMIQPGQHVRPGDELFQITDFDPLVARIYLPEKDILGLEEGRRVRITLNAADDVRFPGRIRQINPIVDTATGTVKVTVEAGDPPPVVRPGSFVTIDIVRETRADTLVLPREAVRRELQKAHVFVADGDTAHRRSITLGLEEGELVEVVSGLEDGETVVVAGQGGLRDGSLIRTLDEQADSGAESQEG